jgi:hypothetical protein
VGSLNSSRPVCVEHLWVPSDFARVTILAYQGVTQTVIGLQQLNPEILISRFGGGIGCYFLARLCHSTGLLYF